MPKIERLPSGSYRIRFTDPWGRRAVITRKTAADTRAAYRRALGDMSLGQYVDVRKGRQTVASWADEWLAGARNLSRGGHDTYRRDLDRHILPALGELPVGKLSAGDIDAYLNGLRQRPPDGRPAKGLAHSPGASGAAISRPLAPSTVHRHYRTIHRMLEVARQRGLIAKNPCEQVQPPVVPRTQRPVLDPLQIDALADAITARYRAWVYVMCYGGLRWSESVGLRRLDVDLPRVRVVGQMIHRGRGEWERVEPKAGSRRTVTLPPFAAAELAAHLDTYSLPGLDGLVFPTKNGTPIQSPSFSANTFRRALRKAGLPLVRIHDLRHTAVSLAIDAGANVKAGQARAGHASSSLHLDLYGHAYPGSDEAIATGLEELRAKALRGRLRAV